MLLWTKNSSFCAKSSKFCINRANKNKAQMWFWRLASNYVWGCSRGNVWLIWLKFSDNVGMILVFIWYSHQKILRPPSSPQKAHLKCLKTYWLPCNYWVGTNLLCIWPPHFSDMLWLTIAFWSPFSRLEAQQFQYRKSRPVKCNYMHLAN